MATVQLNDGREMVDGVVRVVPKPAPEPPRTYTLRMRRADTPADGTVDLTSHSKDLKKLIAFHDHLTQHGYILVTLQ